MPEPLQNRIDRDTHRIDTRLISHNALDAVAKLKTAGYSAYLVGGCVRDLLLGLHPKDFDVSTDATPEQVIKIFKRARIIGRRFKIVHLYYGRELIEVTTFRGHHPDEDHPHAIRSTTGQLLRDNVFGSLEEDALRRDFTANALYFDPDDEALIDYVQGYEDIQQHVLRVIGEPDQRYQEDPVRMLRAARFCAKLGFTLEANASEQISRQRRHLNHIPPARLFDESLKLFLSGYSEAAFEQLLKFKLFELLFPYTPVTNTHTEKLVHQALINTDQRLRHKKGVTPAFLFAVMLWALYRQHLDALADTKQSESGKRNQAAQLAFSDQYQIIAIPRRFSLPARDIWDMQYILESRPKHRINRTLQNPRFRAAYDFLLLRAQSGEPLDSLCQWWTDIQHANETTQQQLINELPANHSRKNRRPRKRRPRQNNK